MFTPNLINYLYVQLEMETKCDDEHKPRPTTTPPTHKKHDQTTRRKKEYKTTNGRKRTERGRKR